MQVAKLLLSSGDIVLISDSAGVRDIYSADGSGTLDTKTPLSVWVNKGTASASEVRPPPDPFIAVSPVEAMWRNVLVVRWCRE